MSNLAWNGYYLAVVALDGAKACVSDQRAYHTYHVDVRLAVDGFNY